MKFVVTGATGMIGYALVNQIKKEGHEVVALVHSSSKRISVIPNGVETVSCGLDEYGNYEPDFKADVFVHLAWGKTDPNSRDNKSAQEANVQYTVDAVKLANKMGCKVFVGAGSQAEYGVKSEPLTCNTLADPQSEYGKAKLKAGVLAKAECDKYGIRFNWCRILSVYGIGDNSTTLISYIINSFSKGESPVLTKCEQIWDYVYSEDCANAVYLIALRGVNGKIYPIASGNSRKLSEFVNDIACEMNFTGKIGFGEKEYYPHQPMFLCADISELTSDTGFTPKVSFKDGIKYILSGRN